VTDLYGAVEAGGTKFVCAVGSGPDDLRAEVRFGTTSPEETLGRAIAFLREQRAAHGPLMAIGVGCFGPVDLHRRSPTFGHITTTPKAGWNGVDVAGPLGVALGVPVSFDTDVNAAALGEWTWGAARGLDTFLYLTVGTGIGGGGMARGRLLRGLVHPEMGHLRVRRDVGRDPFEGCCPYHGDCLEGLASGPAIEARWGRPAHELPADHPAWELQADYLARAVADLICVLSPQRLVMGGGVMRQARLLPAIRKRVSSLVGGYVRDPALEEDLDRFIVGPELGDRAGVLGAIAAARRAVEAKC